MEVECAAWMQNVLRGGEGLVYYVEVDCATWWWSWSMPHGSGVCHAVMEVEVE